MSSRKTRVDLVRELFATTLKDDEAAFVYLGCSGVILRMLGGTVAFDVADRLTKGEIDALETLNLLLFTHSHDDQLASYDLKICDRYEKNFSGDC